MDKDITIVTESRKVFKKSAKHNMFGLHSKATLEFLPETFTSSKEYHCHCKGTQRNPKCRSIDIAFYVLWKISYTERHQWSKLDTTAINSQQIKRLESNVGFVQNTDSDSQKHKI
jgi:hypothetical protein